MKLAAALHLTSKLTAWIITFAVCSLWLEFNSAGDRVIQRIVREIAGFFSHVADWLIDLVLQVMA